MSNVSDSAIVRLLVADYASTDSEGKLNVIGGGIAVLGAHQAAGQQLGLTAPFTLVVLVAVEPRLYGEECALELILENSAGDPVELPGPAGPQLMRIAQNMTFEEKVMTHRGVRRGVIRSRSVVTLGFQQGLPLTSGERYLWRVKIDGNTRDDWTEEIYVGSPPASPVFG